MKPLTNYVAALNNNDAQAIANLFTEDCEFYDQAPKMLIGTDLNVNGRNELKTNFDNLFAEHTISAELVVDMGGRAFYNVMFDRTMLRCACQTRQENGRIKQMHIYLR